MFHSAKASIVLAVAVLLVAAGFGECRTFAAGKITDVKISPDSRRVIVTADGAMIPAGICRLEGTSKLAIDIPGIGLGDVDRTVRSLEAPVLEVKVSPTASGVRLVMDFGSASVPEHKIRRMENCLILQLSPWSAADSVGDWAAPAGVRSASEPLQSSTTKQKARQIKAKGRAGDLEVKSAEVANGLIVLTVVRQDNPDRLYQIDLGVDLEHSGFHVASIRRLKGQDDPSKRVSGKPHTGAHPAAARVKPSVGAQRQGTRAPQAAAAHTNGVGSTPERELGVDQRASVSLPVAN
jgi:hypothetical protein